MFRLLSFAPHPRVFILSLLAGLAACQAEATKPAPASGSCMTERTDFTAATDKAALPAVPAGGADAYYATLRRTAPDPAQAAAGLATDLAKTADAIDHMTSSFATLKACRFDRAEEIRTGVVGGSVPAAQLAPLLATERANFQGEIGIAGQAIDAAGQRVDLLRQVADQMAAATPGTDLKVARAAAAAPPLPQAYMATASTAIHAKPAEAGARVADLRRGQRVLAPQGGDATPGWVQLALNDGSAGYVETGALRPLQPNPSAVKAAARAEATRAAAGDPVAAAVLAARVALPDRQQALAALVAGAGEGMNMAFNPTLPTIAEPTVPAE